MLYIYILTFKVYINTVSKQSGWLFLQPMEKLRIFVF